MRHLDLFSGIGGFALAAQWCWGAEHEVVAFCEIDAFCQKVLKKHWPEVLIHDDIKTLDGKQYAGTIDLLTGGFPCQPFSTAGKQRGKADDRALWPEMFRVIREVRPRWVIGENVAGFISMGLDDCLADLESEGYEVQPFVIPACAVNAEHRRDRVWIVAHAIDTGERGRRDGDTGGVQCSLQTARPDSGYVTHAPQADGQQTIGTRSGRNGLTERTPADSQGVGVQDLRAGGQQESQAFQRQVLPLRDSNGVWQVEPCICLQNDGVSRGLARHQLKALGNAIVPQVAYELFKAMKAIDETL